MHTVTLSPSALAQIKNSAQESDSGNLAMRFAARMTSDETLEYGMGFDEPKDNDIQYDFEGLTILISPENEELLHGAHIDFVEMEPGIYNFIFLNPNDPNYKPPADEDEKNES